MYLEEIFFHLPEPGSRQKLRILTDPDPQQNSYPCNSRAFSYQHPAKTYLSPGSASVFSCFGEVYGSGGMSSSGGGDSGNTGDSGLLVANCEGSSTRNFPIFSRTKVGTSTECWYLEEIHTFDP
jgi:hypothetical protein